MPSSSDKTLVASTLAGLLVVACSSNLPFEEPSVPVGPPAPIVVLNVNVSCVDCPMASELRPAWLAGLVARCNPHVLMVQELRTQQELDALAAVLPDHEPFHVGMSPSPPSHPHFEAVIWLHREGFRVHQRGGTWLSPEPFVAGTKFPEAEEPHVIAFSQLQDCRSGLISTWSNTALEPNPIVQEASLAEIAAATTHDTVHAAVLAGAFAMAPDDPLYPLLLAPRRGRAFANTMDLAELRDASAAPEVDLQALTDHVLVSTDPPWQVPSWSLESVSHDGHRMSDHPPICTTVQELAPKQRTIPERELCR
jgi:endonuclease/exonuclease/phosphatase family metal-dependent hydrolase